ncbi:MAG: T9SS type A sorting domain-containing protein [Bacteroidetes bacterium]|nr:T9SS type A sorting domain-containing protein [Bacteroidota bacterium]
MNPATSCPNTDQKDLEGERCTGVEEEAFTAVQVKAYPNPAYNHFNLEITAPENEVAEVMIFNSNGKLIANEKLSLEIGINKVGFNSSQYARGIYIRRVVTEGEIFNQRIVLN